LLNDLKKFINEGGLLPHKAKIVDISSEGIFVQDGYGQKIAVTEMSDGFRSVLSMTFDILRELVYLHNADTVFKHVRQGDIFIDLPGVILIDEVDAHLHPTWQTRIGQWFTQYFPNMQFIVTTHSPLVCRASEKGSIWRLAAPDSKTEQGEIIGTEKEKLINGNILDAYGTEVFGKEPVRSAHSDEKKEKLGELNMLFALGKISEEEEKERRRLQKTLSTDDPTGF
jgi:predicted ATP-binding protein involved in virulence